MRNDKLPEKLQALGKSWKFPKN